MTTEIVPATEKLLFYCPLCTCPTCTQRRAHDGAAHPLTELRMWLGWSLERLSREVAAGARLIGAGRPAHNRQKTWRWEHRGVVPGLVEQGGLGYLFGVSSADRRANPWPGWLPTVAELAERGGVRRTEIRVGGRVTASRKYTAL
ncbi:hypothetical protein [Parafrankia discariae]|uniref:hypothetical protein n=1 Tax=Parafrankia discariae TaxID=365528 RepID=UPI0003629F1A|nr:hypothetical protein [Parafrankia discariae]